MALHEHSYVYLFSVRVHLCWPGFERVAQRYYLIEHKFNTIFFLAQMYYQMK